MKSAKISKDNYNYLKENEQEATKILKTLKKRREKGLPVDVLDSSDLSQSTFVEIDLTGKKPIAREGVKTKRDMPIAHRRGSRRIEPRLHSQLSATHDISQQIGEAIQVQSILRFDLKLIYIVDDDAHSMREELMVFASDSDDQQSVDGELPEALMNIVQDLYNSVLTDRFSRSIPLVTNIDLDELSFAPLSATMTESNHIDSFIELGNLANDTLSLAFNSYSLRCFNYHLAKTALVEKILSQNNHLSRTQALYSLKSLYRSTRVLALDYDQDLFDAEWDKLKQTAYRGKVLYEFMDELKLGTGCKVLLTF